MLASWTTDSALPATCEANVARSWFQTRQDETLFYNTVRTRATKGHIHQMSPRKYVALRNTEEHISRKGEEAHRPIPEAIRDKKAHSHTSSSVEARTATERRHGNTDARMARVRWPEARARAGAVRRLFSIATAIVKSNVNCTGVLVCEKKRLK